MAITLGQHAALSFIGLHIFFMVNRQIYGIKDALLQINLYFWQK